MATTNTATALTWTRLNNHLTVLAHRDGYAKHFANRTQATRALETVRATDPNAYIWNGDGRVFYVVLTTVGVQAAS